jgi:broad specificity phosphatase PhoE
LSRACPPASGSSQKKAAAGANSSWQLSEKGRRRCEQLAELLAAYCPTAIVTSTEPKAIETGQIVASRLSIPVEAAPNLHEHERRNVGLFDTREQFEAKVARLLERPGALVFGEETGEEACDRFAAAIADVLEGHPSGNLAIVSHGTVITLFVARVAGIDPVPFWKGLGLPAFAVLSHPGLALLEVVASVT